MCVRHTSRHRATLWNPLLCAGWTCGQFPLVFEKDLEVVVVPFNWVSCPCTFDTAGDGVNALS